MCWATMKDHLHNNCVSKTKEKKPDQRAKLILKDGAQYNRNWRNHRETGKLEHAFLFAYGDGKSNHKRPLETCGVVFMK